MATLSLLGHKFLSYSRFENVARRQMNKHTHDKTPHTSPRGLSALTTKKGGKRTVKEQEGRRDCVAS